MTYWQVVWLSAVLLAVKILLADMGLSQTPNSLHLKLETHDLLVG